VPHPKRPLPLADRTLAELERLGTSDHFEHRFVPVPQDVVLELLRVYRQAISQDASEDVSPFAFFFA
jgi:hypothetical protein